MTARLDAARVAEELTEIPGLSRAELVARWEKAYRCPPPKGISRRLLEYSAAYQVQVRAFGGLTAASRRKLKQPKPENGRPVCRQKKAPKALASGTRLVREWHGQKHHVEVLREGVAYNGHLYASLSEVARVLTGARWSGPRFFGL